MSNNDAIIIRRAYAESALAAMDKGLSGLRATTAVLNSASKVASRILGRPVSTLDVERLMASER